MKKKKPTEEQETPKFQDPRAEAMARVVTGAQETRDASMAADPDFVIGEESLAAEATPSDPLDTGEAGEKQSVERFSGTSEVDKQPDSTHNPDELIDRDGQQFLHLEVNGEGRDLSLPDARALVQKYANADQQTREAVEAKQLYEQKLAELQNGQPAQPATPTPTRDARPVIDAEELNRTLTGAFQTLYEDGKVSEAASTVADLFDRAMRPTNDGVTREEVTAIAQQTTVKTNSALEDRRVLQKAWKDFSADPKYAAIVKDETLKSKLDELTGELQADPDYMATMPTYSDIFEQAGDKALAWIDNITV